MEDKILQACKIITKLSGDYDLLEWHKTCVEIMNLGLNLSTLDDFISQDNQNSKLGDLEKGNYYMAASYIRNFINWNYKNMPYVKEYSYLVESFIKVVSNNQN